jgi:hypothetical protein
LLLSSRDLGLVGGYPGIFAADDADDADQREDQAAFQIFLISASSAPSAVKYLGVSAFGDPRDAGFKRDLAADDADDADQREDQAIFHIFLKSASSAPSAVKYLGVR